MVSSIRHERELMKFAKNLEEARREAHHVAKALGMVSGRKRGNERWE